MAENKIELMNKKGVTAMVFAKTYAPGPYSPFDRSRTNTARSSRKAGMPATLMKPRNATEKKLAVKIE